MVHDRCNYFSFWAIFCPFTPLTAQKIRIKKKKARDIIILHKCTKNHDHMLYCSWDMAHDRCNCCFSFWAFFCPFTPLTAQKIKILKKWKKMPGDIILLHMCTKNYDQMMYDSWDMVCDRRTDRQMDGRKKWHIEVGAPPKQLAIHIISFLLKTVWKSTYNRPWNNCQSSDINQRWCSFVKQNFFTIEHNDQQWITGKIKEKWISCFSNREMPLSFCIPDGK